MRARDRAQPPNGVLHQARDVHRFPVNVERAGADAAQLQGVTDEPFETLGFVGDGLEQVAALFGIDARPRREQRSCRGLHRRQRRAEVVADGRQKAGTLARELGDELGVAYLLLQAQPVDAGRESCDERFEQCPVGGCDVLGGVREQRHAGPVDADVGSVVAGRRGTRDEGA